MIHYTNLVEVIHNPTDVKRGRDNVPLPMHSHDWTRMPAQRKSVKNKRVAVGVVGGTIKCVQRIERVSSHAHRILFDAYRTSLTRTVHPCRVGWIPSSLGEVRQEKYAKKKRKRREEPPRERKKKKGKKR